MGKIIKSGVVSEKRSALFGIGTISVLLAHSSFIIDYPNIIQVLFGNFAIWGVRIFFYLSALGLVYSMRKNNYTTIEFYKRRFSRVLITFLALGIPFYFWQEIIVQFRPGHFFLKVFLLEYWFTGKGNVWYLAVLIPLYLLFPLIWRCISAHKKHFIVIAIAVWSLIAVLLQIYQPSYYDQIINAVSSVPVFLLGCIMADSIIDNKKLPVPMIIAGIISFPICSILMDGTNILIIYSSSFFGVSVCYIIAVCLKYIKLNLLEKSLSYIGKYSLELYLTNVFLLEIVFHYQLYASFDFLPSAVNNLITYAVILLIGFMLSLLWCRLHENLITVKK